MPGMGKWLTYAEDLDVELAQAREEGRDIPELDDLVMEVSALPAGHPDKERKAGELFDKVQRAPLIDGYEFEEPNSLTAIQEARPKPYADDPQPVDREGLYDKIYGAWLGRCSGCLLGQPVEGWRRDRLWPLLKETGNFPISRYISSDIDAELKARVRMDEKRNWVNRVSYMPEDDDTNYTIIGLSILESSGRDFTPFDAAQNWLRNLPILHVCTAERVAYRNFVNEIHPPESASFRNPYREWIGAQIRADFFGYINPGNPKLAAEYAWRDASISHVKNGIYGEMFVAAMLAQAAVTDDVLSIIRAGLKQIPKKSRLYLAVEDMLSWPGEGLDEMQAIERIHSMYDEYDAHDWCHTISNALIVCVGLIYGKMDLGRSMGIAVTAGFDTDCNGATVGSIVGMARGARSLPKEWVGPLNDQVKSGVDGFGLVHLSDMAKRTMKFCE